ncbi:MULTISPECIES: ABC transporter ATP-binding protein [unclassified Sulfurospirillum]|uniref:ABC transporter ATP-binding protein n=1 Tax=unclassified Sulfurospirillum TaxID=2618290 RepID=UPI0004FF68C0|nr:MULTISPECIES: ABC transporter ATP-binding protein [unclassified Sulfurospirillum]KFL33801.1 macrolide ABC transporter ATP-binding protein [Sulfurospirillum sp. SCADC]
MEEVIKIRHLNKNYHTDAGEVNVLKSVDITIEKGEFVAIMGPSGSGKSTFMNILGCLDKVTSGNYFLGGKDTNALSRDELAELRNHMIGFVFQGFNLIPRQNLIDNVALPLVYAGMKAHERKIRAKEILKSVGLEAFGTYLPNQISGGQQQRVAIARALVNRPKLILADEPTGNLDTKTSEEIMQLFCDLNEKEGITIVLVTHEPDIARYAKRLVNFVDGKIQHDGPTALHVKENA